MLPEEERTSILKGYSVHTGGTRKIAALRADGKTYVFFGRWHRGLRIPRWAFDLLIIAWRLNRHVQ